MVVGTNGACSDTAFVTVVVNQNPVLNISPDASICEGASVILQAGGASNISWGPADGLDTISGPFVTASPLQTTTYTVTGTSNGCTGTAQVTVNVNPNPVVTTGGDVTTCNGQSASLSASGASTYDWSPSTGLDQTTGASVNASPSVNTQYTVVGTDQNGCTATASVNVTVNDVPFMQTSISGTQNNCLPLNGTFSVNPVLNATSYTWTVPAGVTILSGQGTAAVNVSATADFNGNICITAENSCGSSAQNCLPVNGYTIKPVAPGSITGPGKACPGDVISFSVAAVNRAVSYNWTVPAGVTLVSGQGTTNVTLSFGASFTGGTISVTASNGCGVSGLRSKALSLNTPATPGIMSGSAFGICGATITYSVPNISGLTYNWSLPNGATLLSGQGTNSISVQFNSNFSSGNISVTATNLCGTSTARIKAVKGAPAVPASITGATSVCKGQNGVAYSTAAVNGATVYNWTTNSANVTIASGQGTNASTVNFAQNAPNNAVVRVNAGNACGTSSNKTLAVTTSVCPKNSDFTQEVTVFNLLPNPATDYVEVQYNASVKSNAELRLTNILGQVVYSQRIVPETGLNSYMINLREYKSGVYILSVLQDGKSNASRLVIE
jgi:hypothetical protein